MEIHPIPFILFGFADLWCLWTKHQFNHLTFDRTERVTLEIPFKERFTIKDDSGTEIPFQVKASFHYPLHIQRLDHGGKVAETSSSLCVTVPAMGFTVLVIEKTSDTTVENGNVGVGPKLNIANSKFEVLQYSLIH